MATTREYIIRDNGHDIDFSKKKQVLRIKLPDNSQILRNNYILSQPEMIFYLDPKDGYGPAHEMQKEWHYLYLTEHDKCGTSFSLSVGEFEEPRREDHIKTFETRGKIWHLYELKKPSRENGKR